MARRVTGEGGEVVDQDVGLWRGMSAATCRESDGNAPAQLQESTRASCRGEREEEQFLVSKAS